MTFHVGDRVTITQAAWERVFNTPYILGHTGRGIVSAVSRNDADSFNIYYIESYPGIYWEEQDFTLIYEKVNSVFVNNHTIKVGYKFRCRCDYEVRSIYPIWDSFTGRHLKEHANNEFDAVIIASPRCPIHAKLKTQS